MKRRLLTSGRILLKVKKEMIEFIFSGKNVSVEDLNDALVEETETGVSLRRRKESSDTDNEEFKECPGEKIKTKIIFMS